MNINTFIEYVNMNRGVIAKKEAENHFGVNDSTMRRFIEKNSTYFDKEKIGNLVFYKMNKNAYIMLRDKRVQQIIATVAKLRANNQNTMADILAKNLGK
jgi:hypothetical protein